MSRTNHNELLNKSELCFNYYQNCHLDVLLTETATLKQARQLTEQHVPVALYELKYFLKNKTFLLDAFLRVYQFSNLGDFILFETTFAYIEQNLLQISNEPNNKNFRKIKVIQFLFFCNFSIQILTISLSIRLIHMI